MNYLYNNIRSSKRIYEYKQDVKIIVLLRDPVDRAYSAYWQARKAGYEYLENFEYALEEEKERLKHGNERDKNELTYVSHGFYHVQLKSYFNLFKKENIKVIVFEHFIQNKERAIAEVFDFLNIENKFKVVPTNKNKAGVPRWALLQQILSKPKIPTALKPFVPFELRRKTVRYLKALNIKSQEYPGLDKELRTKLSLKYCDEIEKLSSLIDDDITCWKLIIFVGNDEKNYFIFGVLSSV